MAKKSLPNKLMEENSRELLLQYQAGSPSAAREIYLRYAHRLLAAARQMLAPQLAARIDPEDVVQSAYRSFFIEARQGRYEANHAGDLWKLLIAITRHKLLHAVEKHLAAKRTPACEVPQSDFVADAPSPAEVLIVAEELQQLFQSLNADEKLVLELRLQGHEAAQIAAQLEKSSRTVRRIVASLRHRLETRLGNAESENFSQRSPPWQPSANTQLDYREFRLERLVGAGAFGKVYRAYWRAANRTVAVKSLRKQLLLDRRAVEGLLREAETLRSLQHPGILGCHGWGRTPGGGYFLALDWHSCGDLGQEISWTVREIIAAIAQAAEAVAAAHARGIIHCDLKPGNLLRADDGRIVVGDFGFAVATLRGGNHCGPTPLGGTRGYTAPGVLRGDLLPQSDVYSLGRIMEELARRTPGEDSADQKFRSLQQRCLADSPGDRPQAAELAIELRKLHEETTDSAAVSLPGTDRTT